MALYINNRAARIRYTHYTVFWPPARRIVYVNRRRNSDPQNPVISLYYNSGGQIDCISCLVDKRTYNVWYACREALISILEKFRENEFFDRKEFTDRFVFCTCRERHFRYTCPFLPGNKIEV